MSADWLADPRHHLLRRGDEDFPELLEQIPGPPDELYVNGDPGALHLPAIAIVGSRNPTQGGLQNAFEFARHLGSRGFCIVSGLAQGIDTAAHRGALEAGAPTVAFLGHGIDRVYPASNRQLAHDIAGRGALVSEFPLGMHPARELFPQRNRLISGISMGTLVVEAARRSGSLITARLAGELGREVFAIPGSIHNPQSRGCHRLIRDGARLVETTHDVLTELAPVLQPFLDATIGSTDEHAESRASETAKPEKSLAPEYVELLKTMGFDPIDINDIADRSTLTTAELSSMLLLLELEGHVEALPGGRYMRLS